MKSNIAKIRVVPLFLFFLLLTSSCSEDIPTPGEKLIADIQAVITENFIREILVPGEVISSDFSFQNETLRVGSYYFNVNQIVHYRVETFLNAANNEANRLVIIMSS